MNNDQQSNDTTRSNSQSNYTLHYLQSQEFNIENSKHDELNGLILERFGIANETN